MKQTIAGIILVVIWVGFMLFFGDSKPDVRNYNRNQNLENPCDFMNSGQYSVNC
jgi:hypothetical protein